MKSKYTKIKYTNTGVKAPVVTCMRSNPDLDRSDMIELNYPEIKIVIKRVARKTMYNRSKSLVYIFTDTIRTSFYVYDTINDTKIIVENFYIYQKVAPYLSKYDDPCKLNNIFSWDSVIYDQMKKNPELYEEIGRLISAKES